MKKVLITFALAFCAIAANAQFVLGIDASVNIDNGSTQINTSRYINTMGSIHDTNYNNFSAKAKTVGFGVGFTAGYQFGRARVGLGFSYNTASLTVYEFCDTIVNYDVWTKTTTKAIGAKLFFRYDLFQFGDISIFAQLDGTFISTPNTQIQEYTNRVPVPGTENFTSRDTTYKLPLKMTNILVTIEPGVSWQITPWCSLDLYLDIFQIGYISSKAVARIETPSFLDPNKTDVVETTTSDGNFIVGWQMSPNSLFNDLSLFRLGFNFTF